MLFVYLSAIYLGLSFQGSEGCTLPSYILNGVWESTDYGMLTVNGTAMGPITVGSHGDYYFECYQQVGTKYIVRSTEVKNILSVDQSFYLCLDMRYQSNNKYIYYLATSTESAASGQKVKILAAASSPSSSQICDLIVPDHQYDMLVKNGTASSGRITCPSWILGEFNYTSSSCQETFATSCIDNSVIMSNSTLCPAHAFDGGNAAEVYCLFHMMTGSVNYLTGYSGSAYRCYVSEVSGTTVSFFSTPDICPQSDVPSSVSNSALLFLDLQASCPIASTTTQAAPTTSVGQQKGSSRRAALDGLLSLVILITALCQAL